MRRLVRNANARPRSSNLAVCRTSIAVHPPPPVGPSGVGVHPRSPRGNPGSWRRPRTWDSSIEAVSSATVPRPGASHRVACAAKSRVRDRFEEDPAESPSPSEAPVLCACSKRLLPGVPEAYRGPLGRIDLQGEESDQLAKELGLTPNRLTVRLHRARRHPARGALQVLQACSQHGCLNCSCDDPGSGSPPG